MTLRPSLGSRGTAGRAAPPRGRHDSCLGRVQLVAAELAFVSDGAGGQLAGDGDVFLGRLELVHLAHDDLELLVAARQQRAAHGVLRKSRVGKAGEDL